MDDIITRTTSLCPVCLAVIPAQIAESGGRVLIKKECRHHGSFETPHPWSQPAHYHAAARLPVFGENETIPAGLVINLNSACNLDCPYCFARANEYMPAEPTMEDIKERLRRFKGKNVYVSGGEPALRTDILEIIRTVKSFKFKAFLFSNGKKLADESFARALKASGLDCVILQFDTLQDDQNVLLRGEKLTAVKISAVENLQRVGIPVYLFAMIAKDINTGQIAGILNFAA